MENTIKAMNADVVIIPAEYTMNIHNGIVMSFSVKASGVEKIIHNRHTKNTIKARTEEIVCNLYPDSF